MSNEETRGRPKGERAKALAAGRKYYHTGKPCINGHIAERKTADGKCIECLSSYQYVDLRPRKCANIHCEKVFTPRMRKYKKGFTEQSLKDARLEYCSVQCHREKRKRYFWASGDTIGALKRTHVGTGTFTNAARLALSPYPSTSGDWSTMVITVI
jgi:hypothetical protein